MNSRTHLPKNIAYIIAPLVVALLVGLVHIIPTAYMVLRLGSKYKGIFAFRSADAEHYNVNIRMAMLGFYSNQNNYLAEGRTSPKGGLPPVRSEAILGFIGAKLGVPIGSYIVMMRFFLPALAFSLLYILFRSILNISRRQAVFWSCLIMFSPYLLFGWFGPISRPVYEVLSENEYHLPWQEQYFIATLPFARIVNPQFSGLFFIAAMITLFKLMQGKKKALWFIASAFLFYLNFRFYFYFWSTLGALLGLLFLLSCLMRDKKNILLLGAFMALSFLGALPQVIAILKHSANSGINFAYVHSRAPIISPGCVTAFLILAGAIVLLWKKILSFNDAAIVLAMPLTVLTVMNQQVVTGRIVQPWHYELFVAPILLAIALGIVCNRTEISQRILAFLKKKAESHSMLLPILSMVIMVFLFLCGMTLFFYYFKLAPQMEDAMTYISAAALMAFLAASFFQIIITMASHANTNVENLKHILGLGLILLVFAQGMTRQSFVASKTYQQAAGIQHLAAPFAWLEKNTPPNSVVLSSFGVAERIPLFTHNAVYLCKNAIHEHIPSEEERFNRVFNYFILTGHDEDRFRARLAEWPYGYLFWGIQNLEPKKDLYSFGKLPSISEKYIKKLLVKYMEKRKITISFILREYKLDYIFFSPAEKDFFPVEPAAWLNLEKVYEDETPVIIYKIKTDF
ncbi:MAG TPA: hypothetical protein P5128_00705 [Candidatus Sumerlaeia bacterium]|nr:hypothetical protein [Candidatus Sumerlaeia bacterium]